jgi:hypothetical protein
MKPNSVHCQKYDEILSADNELLFAKYNSLYRGFLARLSDLTGYNVTMQNIDDVFDATFREVQFKVVITTKLITLISRSCTEFRKMTGFGSKC